MKVFDLHCPQAHVFEGWFGSEADFLSQMARGLVQCPLCGSQTLRKGLSAPRLNLGTKPPAQTLQVPQASQTVSTASARPSTAGAAALAPEVFKQQQALQAAWLEASRKVVAATEDVGTHFADEALRMHQGATPARPIRGQATPQQAMELLEEGVPILPLALPGHAKETLQ